MQNDDAKLRLYLAHRAALVEYAAPIVGDRHRAEDVVQEAYIRFRRADEKRSNKDPVANPTGYLYRVVRNLAIDLSRRCSAEISLPNPTAMDDFASDTPSVEQTLLYRDELRVLAEALAELPERTRVAFNMHRLEGRTLQEVADHLGVSVVRVHQMVKEALLHGTRRLAARDK